MVFTATTNEVGRVFQTPGFGRKGINKDDYRSDHSYAAVLVLPKNISATVGSGSLVVELEVDTREEKGWQEEVDYWQGSKYKVYKDKKTQVDADSHCRSEAGHLASIETEEEQEEMTLLLEDYGEVWIGASDQVKEGDWRWSDGSPLGLKKWGLGEANRNPLENCAIVKSMESFVWADVPCEWILPYVCQASPYKIKGQTNLTLEYTKHDLFDVFKVKYTYRFVSKEVLDTYKDKRTTGFRLSWFVKYANGSDHTIVASEEPVAWRIRGEVPRFRDPYLLKMIKTIRQAPNLKLTRDEIIAKIVKEKSNILNSGSFEYASICAGNQVLQEHLSTLFDGVQVASTTEGMQIDDKDIETGLMMFSAFVYCSESVALAQFLNSLLSNQSPRTIIQAIVNTIVSESIKETFHRNMLNEVYFSLDKIFNFKIGKIILATSSSSQLEAMMAKGWPFITPYSQEINQCLSGDSCHGVRNLVKSLGKHLKN